MKRWLIAGSLAFAAVGQALKTPPAILLVAVMPGTKSGNTGASGLMHVGVGDIYAGNIDQHSARKRDVQGD